MGLMKELNDLNAIYLKMHEQEVSENQDKGYVVTKADKKGNTKAWQGYKAGVKSKTTGKPLYRAAAHLKDEVEHEVDESVGSAIDKGLGAVGDTAKVAGKAAAGSVKVASKVVKGTAKAAGRVAGTAVGAVKSVKKGYQSGADANESYEVDESIGSAIDKGLGAVGDTAKVAGKAAVGGVKVASKVVKGTAKAAGRVAGTAVGAVKSVKKGFKSGADANEEVKVDAMNHYLGELKKVTLASYAKKATTDLANRSFDHGESEKRMYEPDKEDEKEEKKQANRKKGIDRAIDKLAKEDVDVIEKLIESGLFSEEEIDAIVEADRLGKLEESEKVAQGAQKKAEVLASRRRQKGYKEKGYNAYRPGKNERAGYNLSRAARSSDASPETQRTKKKKPAGEDTSQIGHYKKRDEKVTVGKRGKPLKQPKYKLSMGQRVDHHSNKAWSRRDPKQNPKHEANK